MHAILSTPSRLAQPVFNQICGAPLIQGLSESAVLVIGAGGLGCEILKALALSGIKDIHVIDLDTIDLTNLNRQFLFRKQDVGKHKASVAAEFIMNRIPGCKVTPYTKRIQEFPEDFYQKFPVIIAGLDNVEARRWINQVVVQMVKRDWDGQVIPETTHYLIDGGTEGFNGQARVISPYKSACYECTLDQLPKQVQYQMCTIASTPRLPEHCIAYAYEVLWPNAFQKKVDKDSYEDMNWIFQKASERAKEFKIEGVTYKLTMGVVKNIIPAVASTNALIAAHCVNECLKILTGLGSILDNYFMWVGQAEAQGVSINVFQQERTPKCSVCLGSKRLEIKIQRDSLLRAVVDQLPSQSLLNHKNETLVSPIAAVQEHFEKLQHMKLRDLIQEGVIAEDKPLVCLDGMNRTLVTLVFLPDMQE